MQASEISQGLKALNLSTDVVEDVGHWSGLALLIKLLQEPIMGQIEFK